MLDWALTFLLIAIVAAILGFGGVTEPSYVWIARVFFVVFLALFLAAMISERPWRP